MEPLRLELSESTSLQLQKTPQAIRDDVEMHHSQLISQVRWFYAQKQRELEQYAQLRIKECSVQEPATPRSPTRKIKSIVKRRPSTADKRVSFSKSPPQVELFKDECDSDESEIDNPAKRAATLSSNGSVSKAGTGAGESAEAKSIPSTSSNARDDNSAIERSNSSTSGAGLRVAKHAIDFKQSVPVASHYDDLFDFEDVIEGSSVSSDPDLSVESHHSASSPTLEPELSPAGKVDIPSSQHEPVLASSAAMDIVPSQKGIDSDGGPVPKTEAGRQQEAEEKLDIEMSMNNLSLSKLGSSASGMDPSQMSFSRRMEWEDLWRMHGHRNIV